MRQVVELEYQDLTLLRQGEPLTVVVGGHELVIRYLRSQPRRSRNLTGEFTCKRCGFEGKNKLSLSMHVNKRHKRRK